MNIYQNPDVYTTFLGWYGLCDQGGCESFDLLTRDPLNVIYAIYQFSADGTGTEVFLASSPTFLQSFTKLTCGKAYWIVLDPGTGSIAIPGFVVSNESENEFGYIVSSCDATPTPAPHGTPTPVQDTFTSQPHGHFHYEITNTSGDSKYGDAIYKNIFHQAFNRWDAVITSGPIEWQLDVKVDFAMLADNILGGAWLTSIARTGPEFDFGQTFPAQGEFQINTKYIDQMLNKITTDGKSELYYVALHEIGHLLGIGYITFDGPMIENQQVANYVDESDQVEKKYYYGEHALREYRAYFPAYADGIVGIPIEDDGGPGTANAHPEEGGMGFVSRNDRYINGKFHPGLEAELMTGWSDANAGVSLPMSRITIGFLEDIGFSVDYSSADEYSRDDFSPEAPIDNNTPTPVGDFEPDIPCNNLVEIPVDISRGECNVTLPWLSESNFTESYGYRTISANNIPSHNVGLFGQVAGALNPNAISPQNSLYQITLDPVKSTDLTPLQGPDGPMYSFGIFLNGVELDPVAAEPWPHPQGPPPWPDVNVNWDWNLEASMVQIGLDCNSSHVQPTGKYHYHGVPTLYLQSLLQPIDLAMDLLGYAADGFPIYSGYGPSNPTELHTELIELKSSYRLKSGQRPGDGIASPCGSHTGVYTADWEYVEGLGDLDECNGRDGVTPEYPDGTYYYVITNDYPGIPRYFRGTPSDDFRLGQHGPPPGS